MEATSIKRKTKSRRLMKTYFQSLIDLGYSQVSITSTDIADIKVSQLQKIGKVVTYVLATLSKRL